MLLNRKFHTGFGIIHTGEEANTEDVKRYFMYRRKFFQDVNLFRAELPNWGRDARMTFEPHELFSKELIEKAEVEIKKERINIIRSKIHSLKEELKIIENEI